jgi:heme exporter protein A
MRLTALNLATSRGDHLIFSGLSFSLGPGEALLVTGANGAGKSTLLKTLAGRLQQSAGSIALEGADEGPVHEHCHYLSHANALKPALTVAENLDFWRGFLSGDGDIDTALEEVGLPGIADIPAGYLSAGQKRRVAIARLLMAHRPVWLADEPTAALDAASEKMFARLVNEHLASGGIVIAATHQKLAIKGAGKLDMKKALPEPAA